MISTLRWLRIFLSLIHDHEAHFSVWKNTASTRIGSLHSGKWVGNKLSKTRLSPLSKILELRLLVGFLGEEAQFGWWPTSFYGSSSRPFLEPVFARTSKLARYYAVVDAAQRAHDEHLQAGAYHLFRLPEEIEQDLHEALQTATADLFVAEKETALSALMQPGIEASEGVGPVLVGQIEDLRTEALLSRMAEIYYSAFTSGNNTFPYLVK